MESGSCQLVWVADSLHTSKVSHLSVCLKILKSGDLCCAGIAIFFDKAGDHVPTVCEEFLRKFEARPDVEVFLHIRALPVPHVSDEEKFTIARTSLPNFYRIVVRHGCNDIVVTENLGGVVYSELRRHIIHTWGRPCTGYHPASQAQSLQTLIPLAPHARRLPMMASSLLTTGKWRRCLRSWMRHTRHRRCISWARNS
jgi:hypothetical protein